MNAIQLKKSRQIWQTLSLKPKEHIRGQYINQMFCFEEKPITYASQIWQSSLALMKEGVWQYWHILQHFQNRAFHSEKSKCFIFDIFCTKHFNFSIDMSAGWIPPTMFLEVRVIEEGKYVIQSLLLYSSQIQWTLRERMECEENITLRS